MRKLSWLLIAVCLLSLPLFGQSRRRGYTAAGGWHRKPSTPAPTKKQSDKRPTPAPPRPATPTR